MCEGTTYDDQLRSLRTRFERFGWTAVSVAGDGPTLGWAYTVGLIRAGHAELVVVDEPPDLTARLFEALTPQLLAGRTLVPGATLDVIGRTWAVLPVDPSHIRAGMMAWWPEVFPHCPCHAEPFAVQLIDIDDLRPADGDGGLRLDRRHEPSRTKQAPRAQRRRQERAEAKRRRREGS